MLLAENRLRKRKDFDEVYKRGQGISGPLFNLRLKPNGLSHSRFAFVVSKKTEKIVAKRNLAKRRLRSIVRKVLPDLKKGIDIVVTVKQPATALPYNNFETEFFKILKRARLFKD